MRIRNLESEVSRLLGENVSLREQIIKLHYTLDNSVGRGGWDKVDGLKQKLESGLTELGSILQELGEVQNKAVKECPAKRNITSHSSPKRSPNPRQWKNNLNLSDFAGEVDGRLPPILEDKCFPRRTLKYVHMAKFVSAEKLTFGSGTEMQGILADSGNFTDSPELGPPPVAVFEEGDPIKFTHVPERASTQVDSDTAAKLSSNLETRRKRRESFHQRNPSSQSQITDLDTRELVFDGKAATVQALKPGAKRKLNMRDEDDQPRADTGKDEFRYLRKGSEMEGENMKSRTISRTSSAEQTIASSKNLKQHNKPERYKDPNPLGARRALGPKSVNSDPQSPAKLARSTSTEKDLGGKQDLVKRIRERNQGRDKQNPTKVQKAVRAIEIPETREVASADLPPKTPILPGLDLFSPTTSDPSERRPELRDTPPPPDLGPDTGTGSFGRSSRRSRGSVSYAEPNLRDKMRRPTKDLIDAVGAEEKLRQAAANREGAFPSVQHEFERNKIKQEENNESQLMWKTNPLQESRSQQQRLQAERTSPLGKKANLPAADLPASVMTERRRRTSTLARKEDDGAAENPTSAAGTVIAALSGAPYKTRPEDDGSTTKDQAGTDDAHRQAADRVSIFDFTSSSPEHPTDTKDDHEGPAKPMRVSRRHSSVPALADHGKGSITISRRRRETLLGKVDGSEKAEGPEQKSTKGTSGSETAAVEGQGSLGRSERAASRRRSMMV